MEEKRVSNSEEKKKERNQASEEHKHALNDWHQLAASACARIYAFDEQGHTHGNITNAMAKCLASRSIGVICRVKDWKTRESKSTSIDRRNDIPGAS
jgi:hypothetical protein